MLKPFKSHQPAWLKADVAAINDRALTLLAGSSLAPRCEGPLRADARVLRLIHAASAEACRVASLTPRPLVSITTIGRAALEGHLFQVSDTKTNPPNDEAELNIMVLLAAQRLAAELPAMATIWFELSLDLCERISAMPNRHLIFLASTRCGLVAPVFPNDTRYWERVLIAERAPADRALKMIALSALMGARSPVRVSA